MRTCETWRFSQSDALHPCIRITSLCRKWFMKDRKKLLLLLWAVFFRGHRGQSPACTPSPQHHLLSSAAWASSPKHWSEKNFQNWSTTTSPLGPLESHTYCIYQQQVWCSRPQQVDRQTNEKLCGICSYSLKVVDFLRPFLASFLLSVNWTPFKFGVKSAHTANLRALIFGLLMETSCPTLFYKLFCLLLP